MNQNVSSYSQYGIFPHHAGDLCFIWLIVIIAITTGVFAYLNPQYFLLILFIDLWLLGYHHVISTFTRIGFDKASVIEHWKLVLPLPLVTFISVYYGYQLGGGILIGSIYIYWQWYHYTRQSEGIAKSYGMKAGSRDFVNSSLNRTLFYLVPLSSFLYLISSGPNSFLNIPIATFNADPIIRTSLLFICLSSILVWLIIGIKALSKKEISYLYFNYMLSHFLIYVISYVVIDEINYCWLITNIWHNAQYIGFVWLYNRKRYAKGVEPEHRFISYVSQPGRFVLYMAVCMIITTVVYYSIKKIIPVLNNMTEFDLALTGIIYFAINFHHYIVDSKIWKLRKPEVRTNLLSSTR
jgi:hypothetical protein